MTDAGPSTSLGAIAPRRRVAPTLTVRGARKRKTGIALFCLAIAVAGAGGTLHAFRWDTPAGNITISRIGVLLLAPIAIPFIVRTPTRFIKRVVPAGVALVASWLLSTLYSTRPGVGYSQVADAVEAVALAAFSYCVIRILIERMSDQSARRWLEALPLVCFVPAMLIGLWQIAQIILGQVPSIPFIHLSSLNESSANAARTLFDSSFTRQGVGRVAGATGDPSTMGAAAAFISVYALRLVIVHTDVLRHLGLLAFVPAILIVLNSGSAAATVMLFVGLLAMPLSLARGRRLSHTAAKIFLAGLVAVLLLLLAAQWVDQLGGLTTFSLERISGTLTGGSSAPAHLELRASALHAFSDSPFLGIGAGELTSATTGTLATYSSVHSVLFLRLAEGGLIGLAVLLVYLAMWTRMAPLYLWVMAVVGMLMYLDMNRLPLLWVLFGICAALQPREAMPHVISRWTGRAGGPHGGQAAA